MVAEDAEARARREQRRTEKLDKALRAWEDKALNTLLATEEGRQFIWWLLQIGKWQTMPYSGDATNATNFACGEMNVGNQIFARLLEVNPQGYLRIVEDQNARTSPDPNADASSDTGTEPGSFADPDPGA